MAESLVRAPGHGGGETAAQISASLGTRTDLCICFSAVSGPEAITHLKRDRMGTHSLMGAGAEQQLLTRNQGGPLVRLWQSPGEQMSQESWQSKQPLLQRGDSKLTSRGRNGALAQLSVGETSALLYRLPMLCSNRGLAMTARGRDLCHGTVCDRPVPAPWQHPSCRWFSEPSFKTRPLHRSPLIACSFPDARHRE